MVEPPFPLIAIDGCRRLHATLEGPRGAPTVVFDHGAFGMYADGWWLKEALKADHRVLLFGRAGMGFSDPAPRDVVLTPAWHVADLRRLLAVLDLPPPWTLVGHSMAGLRLHAFVNLYPAELSGLVFIDAMRPSPYRRPAALRRLRGYGLAMRMGEAAARCGLVGLAAHALRDDLALPPARADEKRHVFDAPGHWSHSRREILDFDPFDPIFDREIAPELPLAVFACRGDGGENAGLAEVAEVHGHFGATFVWPGESHTSILNAVNAARIAATIRRMTR